jgi:hypothetical protein
MWVAQSLWFDRIWRITAEGERIDAPWRDSTKARDVPKLLYMQLDFSMEAYIAHLETRILADLNRFVFKRSSSTWFSVYAAAFVYLVTLENDSWRLETWKVKLKAWEDLRPVRHYFPPKLMSIVLTSTGYPTEFTSLASPGRPRFLPWTK